jgi:hypothetical protein
VAGFYAARSRTIPPLPWTNFAPPLSDVGEIAERVDIVEFDEVDGSRFRRHSLEAVRSARR